MFTKEQEQGHKAGKVGQAKQPDFWESGCWGGHVWGPLISRVADIQALNRLERGQEGQSQNKRVPRLELV